MIELDRHGRLWFTATLPLSYGVFGYLRIPVLMTEAEWAQMHLVLDAMKPGLVQEPDLPINESLK